MTVIQAAIPPIFENLPPELTSLNRWILWRHEEKGPNQKPSKIPYAPHEKKHKASSTNAATWGTFAQAQTAYMSGGYSGVGLVLNGDGVVGIDLDNCVHDGEPSQAAKDLLESMSASYVELSPSGKGLRAIGYGDQLDAGVNGSLDGLKAEFYSDGRYLTLTGNTVKLTGATGAPSVLKGFKATAEKFRAIQKVNPATGQHVASDEKQAAWIEAIKSGEVYHDSLRNLAASFVAQGMPTGSVIIVLKSLMESVTTPHDDRWLARYAQIPDLVKSAFGKFAEKGFQDILEGTPPDGQRYKLLGSADLHALPPLQWRVRSVLPADGLAAWYGPSGSGKSFIALDVAAAIAEGSHWFGCRVESAPVVYVVLEGEAGFKSRAQAWETQNNRALPDDLHLVLQPFTLTQPQDLVDLATVVPAGAVVFIDTLNRAAPTADENSSKDMGQILEAAKALQTRTKGLVVLVHHTGKDTSKGLRGHSSLFAAMDAAVEVSRDGDRRSWKVSKSKDGQDGQERGFCLEIVSIGVDAYGDALTSCVVVPTESPILRTRPLTKSQQSAMDALSSALAGDYFDSGVNRDVWRDAFYPLCDTENLDAKRQSFGRAITELVAQGRVSAVDNRFLIPEF